MLLYTCAKTHVCESYLLLNLGANDTRIGNWLRPYTTIQYVCIGFMRTQRGTVYTSLQELNLKRCYRI